MGILYLIAVMIHIFLVKLIRGDEAAERLADAYKNRWKKK